MFEKYPKERPVLPDEYQKIYDSYYKLNRDGETTASAMSQAMESWLHKQVAKDVKKNGQDKVTLEIGAGTLNQFAYEPEVATYDIIEPFKSLYANSPLLKRIRNEYNDISEVPSDSCYDRITSSAVLEHICNLPEVVATSGILLKKDGCFRASIPSEGTFLWTLGWKVTTGIEFRIKYGLDKGVLMRHEHVNDAKEIEEILEYFFDDVRSRSFGIAKWFSLYQFYECRKPNIEKCKQYLDSIGR
jgi:hypothetical protein